MFIPSGCKDIETKYFGLWQGLNSNYDLKSPAVCIFYFKHIRVEFIFYFASQTCTIV